MKIESKELLILINIENKSNRLIITVLLAVLCMIIALVVATVINLDNMYWGLFLTTGQLIATLILIQFFGLGKNELGLAYNRSKISLHILSILALSIIIILVKYLVEGIQSINEVSFSVMYYFFFYLVVATTEELYFRGVLYNILESWSRYAALFGSSIIFGLFHIRSGFGVVIVMIFTGLSFAIVRYVSGMILLIIPFHLFFNWQSALIVFNNSTAISATLYLVLSIIVVFLFVLLDSSKQKTVP